MSDTRQIVRQLDILRTLLTWTFGATYRKLADESGVSERTIQRDIKVLREAGFMINEEERDYGKKYFKLVKNNLPPLNFPTDEIIALTFIEGIVSPLEDTPYKEAFQKTLNRIRNRSSRNRQTQSVQHHLSRHHWRTNQNLSHHTL